MIQLPLFAFTPGQAQARLCVNTTQPPESQLESDNQHFTLPKNDGWEKSIEVEKIRTLDPSDVLGLDPLLVNVSAEATGILAKPAWSAVFATRNLLDHLGHCNPEKMEAYEQHIYNIIWQARLELDLASQRGCFIPFYYHTESIDLHLALVIRNEFQPPAAVIGLAEDF